MTSYDLDVEHKIESNVQIANPYPHDESRVQADKLARRLSSRQVCRLKGVLVQLPNTEIMLIEFST